MTFRQCFAPPMMVVMVVMLVVTAACSRNQALSPPLVVQGAMGIEVEKLAARLERRTEELHRRLDLLARRCRRLSGHRVEDAQGHVQRRRRDGHRGPAVSAGRDHQSGDRGRPRSGAASLRHRDRIAIGQPRRVQDAVSRRRRRQSSARMEAAQPDGDRRERGERPARRRGWPVSTAMRH